MAAILASTASISAYGRASQLIKDRFGVELSLGSVGALLARLGLTPQKPLQRAYERNPEAIEAWKAEVYPKLAARVRKLGADIYFWDEAGFRADAVQGRTWGKKGQTPLIDKINWRKKEWRELVASAKARTLKSGLIQIVAEILDRCPAKVSWIAMTPGNISPVPAKPGDHPRRKPQSPSA